MTIIQNTGRNHWTQYCSTQQTANQAHYLLQVVSLAGNDLKGIYGLAMKQLQFNGPDHKRWQIINLTAIVTSARKKHWFELVTWSHTMSNWKTYFLDFIQHATKPRSIYKNKNDVTQNLQWHNKQNYMVKKHDRGSVSYFKAKIEIANFVAK